MRLLAIFALLALALGMGNASTLRVGGDIGPGMSMYPPTLQIAGDIGPGS